VCVHSTCVQFLNFEWLPNVYNLSMRLVDSAVVGGLPLDVNFTLTVYVGGVQ
jgi:hypothetical protein